MFTGLIEAVGTVLAIEERAGSRRITVEAPGLAAKLSTGDSIAVSGVCLTALDIAAPIFHADLAAETVARTSLTRLAPGTKVNLELPTPAGAPLGGHVVQGHVDTTGTLISLKPIHADSTNQTDWWLEIEVPESLRPFMVEKGSVAIEGISLTIARWDGEKLSVAIIPHTYAATNLHTLAPGSPVNLEADILIKMAQQKLEPKPAFELTVGYLIANGY
ncbi:riboflavin synthase [Silvibacterium acidisoli]|uniref:riboflavin synthase n=1 Tax=Acidobacteriaceae bacterium ZG23-2 TaxID=2883246 RepID=UPI00406D0E13